MTAVGLYEEASSATQEIFVHHAPVAVVGLQATRTGAGVQLTWDVDPRQGPGDTYRVARDGVVITVPGALGSSARSFVDVNPPQGRSVSYTVITDAALGVASSASVDIIPAAPPGAPVVTLQQIDANVSISWTAATGTVSGYLVRRNGIEIADVDASINRFLDFDADVGVVLTYDVVAYGPYRDEDAVSGAQDITVAFAPQIGTVTATQFGAVAVLSWSAPGGTITSIDVLRDGGACRCRSCLVHPGLG